MGQQIIVGVVVAASATTFAAVFAGVRASVRLFWRMDHLEAAVGRLETNLDGLAEDLRAHMAAEERDVDELKDMIRQIGD